MIVSCQCFGNDYHRFVFLSDTYYIALFYDIRGDIQYLAVYYDVLVAYQLAGGSSCGCHSQAVNDIIQTAFQQLNKYSTCDTFLTLCFYE